MKNRRWIGYGIFFLLIATQALTQPSCHQAPLDRGSLPGGRVLIVVLGSSTAAGTGASRPESAWVNLYASHLRKANPRIEIRNLAVGGYTTYEVMPLGFKTPPGRPMPSKGHTISDALDLGPSAIIVNLPSNDAARGIPLREQLANYDTLRERAASAGVSIWISTPQPRNLADSLVQWQRAARDSLEARIHDHAIDFWTGLASPSGHILAEYDSGDGIHVNDRGHRILFEQVLKKNIPETIHVSRGK